MPASQNSKVMEQILAFQARPCLSSSLPQSSFFSSPKSLSLQTRTPVIPRYRSSRIVTKAAFDGKSEDAARLKKLSSQKEKIQKEENLVYFFGDGLADGDASMASVLGGKGANLAEMTRLGLPVPPGFTLPTSLCLKYQTSGLPTALYSAVEETIFRLENLLSKKFGDTEAPLLLSVRSGAPISMPGMLDTVLNLGLNDKSVQGLAKMTNNERFAWDSYRRFIQMFGNVVLGIPSIHFEEILEQHKKETNIENDSDLSAENLKSIVRDYKRVVEEMTGKPFKQDAREQLWEAIAAVFMSWTNDRAVLYRKLNGISEDVGTAVTVQAMVFGNSGESSATGVAFTRDPSTGADVFYGEFLRNAQGEDVVAGIRTPQPITRSSGSSTSGKNLPAMEDVMPSSYKQLVDIRVKLERHFRDVQDIEFTIQDGKMYILQTRNAKRSARAAVKIAVDLVREGVLSKDEALLRVKPSALKTLLHPTLDQSQCPDSITIGMPASPGAACGRVALNCAAAEVFVDNGEKAILVREDTSPEDVAGMHVSAGVLTARGGMTSHAAVVARGMGTPCVTGASSVSIDEKSGFAIINGVKVQEGDFITIDGGSGKVYIGEVPTTPARLSDEIQTLLRWADDVRKLRILANADSPADVSKAISMGAEGVGLCRTEHMFFSPERILSIRQMILADNETDREQAVEKLAPMQEEDFYLMLKALDGKVITVRLLDPPLHEFLPERSHEVKAIADTIGISIDEVHRRVEALREANPMLGLRGCRVGLKHPGIYCMQARSLFRAAARLAIECGKAIKVDVMIPFIVSESEMEAVRSMITEVAEEELDSNKLIDGEQSVKYTIGTMIEIPRAALQAGKIAKHAEFFSFGTNDLTQTTYGLSRDDSPAVVNLYKNINLFEDDPFVTVDQDGVGELIRIAVERGTDQRRDLKLCLCGEQGADERSVQFCHNVGMHSVSCSPFRVPIARLAAAHAAIHARS